MSTTTDLSFYRWNAESTTLVLLQQPLELRQPQVDTGDSN